MVKFLLPRHAARRVKGKSYRRGNHARCAKEPGCADRAPMLKILVEFDSLEFDENSRRIRVDFVQKSRFNANERFKPLC
jgi:hypothetical protein